MIADMDGDVDGEISRVGSSSCISFRACLAALIAMKQGGTGMFNSMHDKVELNKLILMEPLAFG